MRCLASHYLCPPAPQRNCTLAGEKKSKNKNAINAKALKMTSRGPRRFRGRPNSAARYRFEGLHSPTTLVRAVPSTLGEKKERDGEVKEERMTPMIPFLENSWNATHLKLFSVQSLFCQIMPNDPCNGGTVWSGLTILFASIPLPAPQFMKPPAGGKKKKISFEKRSTAVKQENMKRVTKNLIPRGLRLSGEAQVSEDLQL